MEVPLIWVIKCDGLFPLPDSNSDSDLDSDSKPYGYIVLCRTCFHWLGLRFGSLSQMGTVPISGTHPSAKDRSPWNLCLSPNPNPSPAMEINREKYFVQVLLSHRKTYWSYFQFGYRSKLKENKKRWKQSLHHINYQHHVWLSVVKHFNNEISQREMGIRNSRVCVRLPFYRCRINCSPQYVLSYNVIYDG